MSKSKGNVVSPDDLVRDYGCDSLRMYELFVGPPELDANGMTEGSTAFTVSSSVSISWHGASMEQNVPEHLSYDQGPQQADP